MVDFRSIDACGRTDRGRVRPGNEDHFLIGQLDKSLLVAATSLPSATGRRLVGGPEGQVFCVADGLGGHASGEIASATAIDVTLHCLLHTRPCFQRARGRDDGDLRRALAAAVKRAQRAVERRSREDIAMLGMGTTLTLAFLQWPGLHLVHVGDSRCYLFRHRLEQLTKDHTVLQRLIDEGRQPLRSEEGSPLGQALWNAIGGTVEDLFVDVSNVELHAGDTLLLCTDGLVRHVADDEIGAILQARTTAAVAAAQLVEAANAGGGTDNVTVIVARMPAAVAAGEQVAVRLRQDPPDAVPRLA